MVSRHIVDMQLRSIGCNFKTWGSSEVRELKNILVPYEQITECLNGHYENGFAMLCSTNLRIILIDRKPMYLTLEDVRYDMISEIDYGYNLMNASVSIFTPTKILLFSSWNQNRLRKLATSAQQRVMEIRQYNHMHNDNQVIANQTQPIQLQQLTPLNQISAYNSTLQPINFPLQGSNRNTVPISATNPFTRVALTSKRGRL
jgi:hypothetical protein